MYSSSNGYNNYHQQSYNQQLQYHHQQQAHQPQPSTSRAQQPQIAIQPTLPITKPSNSHQIELEQPSSKSNSKTSNLDYEKRERPPKEPKPNGRPRDPIWDVFRLIPGDKPGSGCEYCSWSTINAKAFRLRAHALVCSNIPDELLVQVKKWDEEAREYKRAQDEHAAKRRKTEAENPPTFDGSSEGGGRKHSIFSKAKEQSSSSAAQPPPPPLPPLPRTTPQPSGLVAASPIASTSSNHESPRQPSSKKVKMIPGPPPPPIPPSFPSLGNTSNSMSKASISQPQPRGSPITCHVLDSTNGKPAPEMRIRLDRLNTTGFTLLAQGVTDGDGRCKNLLQSAEGFEAGIFKITFFTSEYFTKRGLLSFYPFVEIPFEVKNPEEHYHVPLLLSPYAYSTYRGS